MKIIINKSESEFINNMLTWKINKADELITSLSMTILECRGRKGNLKRRERLQTRYVHKFKLEKLFKKLNLIK